MSAGVDVFSTHGGGGAVIPRSALFHFFFQPLRFPNESEGRRSFCPGGGKAVIFFAHQMYALRCLSPSQPPYNASTSVTKQNNRSPLFYTVFAHRFFFLSPYVTISRPPYKASPSVANPYQFRSKSFSNTISHIEYIPLRVSLSRAGIYYIFAHRLFSLRTHPPGYMAVIFSCMPNSFAPSLSRPSYNASPSATKQSSISVLLSQFSHIEFLFSVCHSRLISIHCIPVCDRAIRSPSF
jgi:hypothetical protein